LSSSSIFDPPSGRPKRILCVGAAVLDTLFRVRTLPQGQGKVLPYDMLQIAEGMASSAAYAIARLGGEVSLWGAVGRDATGERIIRDLDAAGIDVSGISLVEGARSAVSTILVDDDGERLIVPSMIRSCITPSRSLRQRTLQPSTLCLSTSVGRLSRLRFSEPQDQWASRQSLTATWHLTALSSNWHPKPPISSFPNLQRNA